MLFQFLRFIAIQNISWILIYLHKTVIPHSLLFTFLRNCTRSKLKKPLLQLYWSSGPLLSAILILSYLVTFDAIHRKKDIFDKQNEKHLVETKVYKDRYIKFIDRVAADFWTVEL